MEPVKILVVEDEVIVARTIASQLNQLGYVVTGTASSGKAAIAKAIETSPELVFMDIILKGEIDGITTASYIREHLDIPVIFLTAYGDDNTIERAKITQPLGYIVKPFTSKDLRISIEMGLMKHRLERDIRENRDRLATLLNSISDAVIATDESGNVTFMNPAAEEITGWHQADAIGHEVSQIFNIIDEVTENVLENPVTKVLREQKVVYLDEYTSLITKDGRRVPIGDSASPIMGLPNKINGVVIVFWDLSERRQTELLEQALQKERELNHLKSLFISTVSHEFRNPLSVIQTAIELIELHGQNLTETKKNTYIRRIKGAVQSMKLLMEDVLFMGKSEAAKLECNLVLLNLKEFCQELIEEFTAVETSGHEIIFTCSDETTNAFMDERLLHYIFVNLLSNAVKYSPQNETIRFDLTCDQTKGVAIFQIQDEGIGIPIADQSHLFESFYRASNSQSIQGTGLGLVIVKRCVEAHKGEIAFSSQEGMGTTFTITLPLNYQ
ncbi:ATP-binding protein [Anabaena sp. FACHB-709]|uniref:histidine kinase n=2 Tax=Nostocaceae TaxID=1162 RepID=A0A1Z4KT91_ANAVA|nr:MULTISPECIES: ATP-binding protein [Nostocaceae]BAY72255.1 two-component hybrid sensor and regulator [Trichormus variabilis NIES-23]HBW29179.1 hybrid sensor histidine kinase/response regulator [Nostoc sp. UBA8866]MBD2170646.1 response regulator [Anabaena cylindrica FACHB-318]MBD2262433.1 response regulator [Anabaena sp. FACHB-709]MBD2271980.1 response regulator [Nostoc sp. PCC 7120 = FACHB-418]